MRFAVVSYSIVGVCKTDFEGVAGIAELCGAGG